MKKFCVIGKGIGYSLSPTIHGKIYAEWGLDAEYTIRETSDISSAMTELRALYSGFNVTKPWKREIIPLLDMVLSDFDSVNTVVNDGGKLIGYNTDYYGFRMDFGQKTRGENLKNVLVIGSGGAAQTVVPALKSLGLRVRTESRNPDTKAELDELYGIDEKAAFSPEIIVNCTPADFSLGDYAPRFIYELRYFGSKMPELCARKGIRYSDGLGMLIYQAIAADEIFFGLKKNEEEKRTLKEKILNEII